MKPPYSKLFIALTLSVVSLTAQADTVYVTDACEITMRSGQSTGHKVLQMLKTGRQLELLETNKKTGYSKVRTKGGREGWSLSRLLDLQPIAKHRLVKAEQRLGLLSQSKSETSKMLTTLTSERDELRSSLTQCEAANERLSSDLADIRRTAANTLSINADNKRLKQTIIDMERELQAIQLEAEDLRDKTARDWFMSGAGVIVLGILIGLIAPRIRLRRKSSWDSFS
ncbi:MAG TPA: TIGR04211 family SH3 domain-containing protein [Chromatiales bacterium]|jgi:SH3 domain protein|nr:TIGR04211 family SH3 domain-containing protein [Chromatiaceae bacterium]HIO54181.1 TIGR04211 family SH3 domain-containing protein [Chromatiales bacterium]